MKSFLVILFFGFIYSSEALADNENVVKRGTYPYMAFIYYSDSSVSDVSGNRFVRSAVLIRPDWLVTTALGPSVVDHANGFPKKTLLARAGAITIDGNFTLNEDEDEQEREIIQIVRPNNHSLTQWWTTDISLTKTLLPFNVTSAVGVKLLNIKHGFDHKDCSILVYSRKNNASEDKFLMQLFVDILPPSIDNCGSHFSASTMVCAADSDEKNNPAYDSNFCHGNSGGPLICNNEVKGLQTYIGNNCKQPHLYQLLSAWENFITCAIEDKCQEEQCGNICEVTYKYPTKTENVPEATRQAVYIAPTPSLLEENTADEKEEKEQTLTGSTIKMTEEQGTTLLIPTNTHGSTASETTAPPKEVMELKSWAEKLTSPKEMIIEGVKKRTEDIAEPPERQVNVEAQQEKKSHSTSNKVMCLIQTFCLGFIALVCL